MRPHALARIAHTAVIQPHSRLSRHPFLTLALLVSAAVLLAPPGAKAQWNAYVGAESRDEGRQADALLPNEIWINVNDTITWKWEPKNEPHTVTFLKPGQWRPAPGGCPTTPNPVAPVAPTPDSPTPSYDGSACVSSPVTSDGATYTIQFPTAGNFKFICEIHTNMNGTVHVLAAGEPLPFIQSDYDKQAHDEARNILGDPDQPTEPARDFLPPNNEVLMTGQMVATPGGRQYLAIVRFWPQTVQIHVGETVEFANEDPTEPHTVTSGKGQTDTLTNDMNLLNVFMQPAGASDGALYATVNEAGDFGIANDETAPCNVASPPATCGVSSGFLQAAPEDAVGRAQSPPGVTRIRVQFNVPGTFYYHCALHDADGMVGTVVVQK